MQKISYTLMTRIFLKFLQSYQNCMYYDDQTFNTNIYNNNNNILLIILLIINIISIIITYLMRPPEDGQRYE